MWIVNLSMLMFYNNLCSMRIMEIEQSVNVLIYLKDTGNMFHCVTDKEMKSQIQLNVFRRLQECNRLHKV